MKIDFFEYDKNCKEYKILLKAVSVSATRLELKEGQLLFKRIFQNINLINSKIHQIQYSITDRVLKNYNSNIEDYGIGGRENILIEYDSHIENSLKIEKNPDHPAGEEYEFIRPRLTQILERLDFSFDYEEMNKKIRELEKTYEENKNFLAGMELNYLNQSIAESIEIVLKHYSDKSEILKKYISAFIENKN